MITADRLNQIVPSKGVNQNTGGFAPDRLNAILTTKYPPPPQFQSNLPVAQPQQGILQNISQQIQPKIKQIQQTNITDSAKSVFSNLQQAVNNFVTYKPKDSLGADIGRALQKVPDTTIRIPEKYKSAGLYDEIVEFVSGLPGAMANSYGKSLELMGTKEGRQQIKTDAKNLPQTISQIKTYIDNKEYGQAFQTAMDNKALSVTLDVSDFIPIGSLATLGAKELGKNVLKTGVKTAVKTEVKPELRKLAQKLVQKGLDEADKVTKIPKGLEGGGGILKALEPLVQEARKYKSAEEFVQDYGKTIREISKGKPSSGVLGEFTSDNKILVKSQGLSKGEIKEVIGHEQRHSSVVDKVMQYFLTKGEKGFDKELSRVEKIVEDMPKVVGVSTEGEVDAQIVEQFTYNNKEFAKRLPELHQYLTNYFNLRKQAQQIPNLKDFYNQAKSGLEGGVKTGQPIETGAKVNYGKEEIPGNKIAQEAKTTNIQSTQIQGGQTKVKTIEDQVSEVKPQEVSVPREQLPVGGGEEKISRLEARVKGVTDKLTQEEIDKLGVATYNEVKNKENIRLASEYIVKNPEDGLKVLKGEIEPPKGILRNAVYLAMEQSAKEDITLATKLASLSSTRAGQEISILRELDPSSPVKIASDIFRIKEEVFKKRYGGKSPQDVIKNMADKGKKEIKAPTKMEWSNLINNIKCK